MLNDDQKKQIVELRITGHGYKTISSIMRISRDEVRGYCKRQGLTGFIGVSLNNLQAEYSKPKEVPNACEECEKPINTIQQRGRKSRFCSDRCRRNWWKQNADKRKRIAMYHYVCEYCGSEFSAYGNKNRKFCSIKCSTEHRFGPIEYKPTGTQSNDRSVFLLQKMEGSE